WQWRYPPASPYRNDTPRIPPSRPPPAAGYQVNTPQDEQRPTPSQDTHPPPPATSPTYADVTALTANRSSPPAARASTLRPYPFRNQRRGTTNRPAAGGRCVPQGERWRWRQPQVAVTSAISLVEQCILDCVQRYGDTCYYLLCGDFNARTGDLNSVPLNAEDTDDLMHLVVAERLESKHLPVELKLNPGNEEGQKVTGTVEKLRWDDRKRAATAGIVSGAVFFLSFLPAYFATTYREKMAASLSFTTATKFGYVGITWSNYDKAVYPNPWSLYDSMLMLLLDTALHLIITWYLDAVLPSEYGVPEPFYFFLTVSLMNPIPSDESHPFCVFLTSDESCPLYFFVAVSLMNPICSTLPRGESDESYPFYVFLAMFPGGKVAVDNLTLNMYEGQITALLGHNGAGKTTTMFLLTGFYPPTSGTAVINGYDIRTELGAVRESLGLCPQHNVLFDTLTVQQQLLLFATFKGSLQPHQETETMLKDAGLETKRHAIARTLSGGQKRKLSVAIALIGESK
ncbi:hypothetical protein BaRGS_00040468, partial [Batillaria attramentaria]